MGVRENKVEKYLDEKIKALGGITRKWVSPGRDGVPDRIVIVRGIVVFVEVKTADGDVSPSQDREIRRLAESGARVTVVRGHDGVDKFIHRLNALVLTEALCSTW